MGCGGSKESEAAHLIEKPKSGTPQPRPSLPGGATVAPAEEGPVTIGSDEPQRTVYPWFPDDDDLIEDNVGMVFVTVHCVTGDNELVVKVKRARDLLHPADGACSPYVVVSVLPHEEFYTQKSKIHKGSYSPTMDESFTFQKVTPEMMETDVLCITFIDSLLPPTALPIGAVKLKLSKLGLDLIMPTWLPLKRVPIPPPKVEISDSPSSRPNSNMFMDFTGSALGHMGSAVGQMGNAVGQMGHAVGNVGHAVGNVGHAVGGVLKVPGDGFKKAVDAIDTFSVAPSLISSFSTATTSVVVKNHDFGKVQLSLQVKPGQKQLQVVVLQAHLNPKAGSAPNPYVKLHLRPSDKETKKKTKAQKSTWDPSFNESFEIDLDRDPSDKKLYVSAWNHELVGRNVFLGEAVVPLSSLPANEMTNQWYQLESMTFGEVNCNISYDQLNDRLNVVIVKARNLSSTRQNSPPDPYVKVYLLPDKKKQTKRKTQGKKETFDPDYNETISYFLAEVDNAKARHLQVSVIDHASVGGNEVIGSFSVPVAEVLEGHNLDAWFPLIKDKDKGSEPSTPM